MMYGIIGKELKSMNIEDQHPQDYLNFYCLGNREPGEAADQGSEKSVAVLLVNPPWFLFSASLILCLIGCHVPLEPD